MTVDLSNAHRFAVYFAPATDSAWWTAGSRWLGRCAATNEALAQPTIDGIAPEQQRQLTADPRRYGWHATLKAPFSLDEGVGLDGLRSALQTLAATFSPFDLPPLRVRRLGGFLALCADGDPGAINAVVGSGTLITYPVGRDKLDVFTDLLTPARVEPAAHRHVELTAVILMLIGSNRGVGVLPDWVIRDVKSHADYVTRPLGPGVITKRLFAATRNEDAARPYIAQFLRLGRSEPVKQQRG